MIRVADGSQWPGIDQCLHLNKSMKGSWLKSTLREGFQWKAALFYANNSSQSTGKCLQTNLIIRERNQIFLRPLETQSDQTRIIRVLLLILERCECMLVLKRGKIPISRIHLGAADKMLKCHYSPSSNGTTFLLLPMALHLSSKIVSKVQFWGCDPRRANFQLLLQKFETSNAPASHTFFFFWWWNRENIATLTLPVFLQFCWIFYPDWSGNQ